MPVREKKTLEVALSRTYEVEPTGNGRASLITAEVLVRIQQLAERGMGATKIGKRLGIGRNQVRRVLREQLVG
jgi:hypothetical protein